MSPPTSPAKIDPTLLSWVPVSSSNVEAVRMAGRTVLAVRFKAKEKSPASVYHYYGADESVLREMLASASKGQFVHQVLRRRFAFSKMS